MRLVNEKDDLFCAFGPFAIEQLAGLRDQVRFVVVGLTAQRGDDLAVDPAGPDGRV